MPSTRHRPKTPTSSPATTGLIAVDKIGNKVLFLDPATYDTVLTLSGFAPRVHELAISPDHRTAFVPIYGDGRHGDNPEPGHLIAVFDLPGRRHVRRFQHGTLPCAARPAVGPRGAALLRVREQWRGAGDGGGYGRNPPLHSPLVPTRRTALRCCQMDRSSTARPRRTRLPPFIDLRARRRLGKIPVEGGLAGIGMSPDGGTVILVNGGKPLMHVVDTVDRCGDTDGRISTATRRRRRSPATARTADTWSSRATTNPSQPSCRPTSGASGCCSSARVR